MQKQHEHAAADKAAKEQAKASICQPLCHRSDCVVVGAEAKARADYYAQKQREHAAADKAAKEQAKASKAAGRTPLPPSTTEQVQLLAYILRQCCLLLAARCSQSLNLAEHSQAEQHASDSVRNARLVLS